LSSRRGGFGRPRKTHRLAPSTLASIRTLVGRFLDDPVHDEFRPGRVLQSKVRPLLRTKAICAVTSKPGASGTRQWIPCGRLSLTTLCQLESVSCCPQAYRPLGSSFPSLKLPPLLEPPGTGHCVAARRPPPIPRDDEAAQRVFWPLPPLPASWHSCRPSP
jgi:hypothetical protein